MEGLGSFLKDFALDPKSIGRPLKSIKGGGDDIRYAFLNDHSSDRWRIAWEMVRWISGDTV